MISAQISYMDFFLLLLIAGLLFFGLYIRREMNRDMAGIEEKMSELEGKHNTLVNFKNALTNKVLTLNKSSDYLQKVIDDKVKALAQSIADVNEKNKMLLANRDELLVKVDQKVDPLKASLDETLGQINKFQNSVEKMFDENEKDLRDLAENLNLFSLQVKKEILTMKNSIRERTIDLEL
ncbi:MAG: hypothetical protein V1758_11425 [Pseudomonadota bacterium]